MLCLAAAALIFVGCESGGSRIYLSPADRETIQHSPAPSHLNESQASCDDSSHGPGGWHGPWRASWEEARKDADEHAQAYPGHRATYEIPGPTTYNGK